MTTMIFLLTIFALALVTGVWAAFRLSRTRETQRQNRLLLQALQRNHSV